jgi:GAF domain-containing protein
MTSAQELLAELGRVADAVAPAVAPPDGDELLSALTETARRLFGAHACSLALLDEDGAELVYTTAAGATAGAVTGMRMPATHGIAGWVVQSGQQVALTDPQNDPRFARDVADDLGYVPREIVAVPVRSRDEVLGVLTLLDRDAARPDAAQDLTLLQLFADQAAVALVGARSFNRMGQVLLRAVAAGADTDDELAAAAAELAGRLPARDRDLAELAALFSQLGRQGAAERRLAVRLVREVTAYNERRSARPGG